MLSLAFIKRRLSISDAEYDTLLPEIEAAQVASFEHLTGWRNLGAPGSIAQVIDGTGKRTLYYRHRKTAGSLVLETRTALSESWTVVDAGDYEEDDEVEVHAIYKVSGDWTADFRNYRVTVTTGFTDENDAPADLSDAILGMIGHAFRNRRVQSPTEVIGELEEANRFPVQVLKTITAYRFETGL